MKKLLVMLLCLILLSGCGNGNKAMISDADEVLFESKETTFTKGQLNDLVKVDDYGSVIFSRIFNKIGADEGYDIEQLRKDGEDYYAEMEASGYAYYATYYYGSKDNYINNYISNEIIYEMEKKEVEENFDTYYNNSLPYKAMIVSFTDEPIANAVIGKVNNGTDFKKACEEVGFTANETVYTDNDTTLPLEVKEYVLNSGKDGVSPVITSAKDTVDENGNSIKSPIYYIVDITDRNVDNFRDEFIDLILKDYDSESFISKVLSDHDIEIYDQDTYDLMVSYYEVLK